MRRYVGASPGAWMKDAPATSNWLGDNRARYVVTDSIPVKGIRRFSGSFSKYIQHGSASRISADRRDDIRRGTQRTRNSGLPDLIETLDQSTRIRSHCS